MRETRRRSHRRRAPWRALALALALGWGAPAPAAVPVADYAAIAQLVESYAMLSRQAQQLAGIFFQLQTITQILGEEEAVSRFQEMLAGRLGEVEGELGVDVRDWNDARLGAPSAMGWARGEGAGAPGTASGVLAGLAGGEGARIRWTDEAAAAVGGAGGGGSGQTGEEAIAAGARAVNLRSHAEARQFALERWFVVVEDCAVGTGAPCEAAGMQAARARGVHERRVLALRASAVDAWAMAATAAARAAVQTARRTKLETAIEESESLREDVSLLTRATLEALHQDMDIARLLAMRLEMDAHGTIGASTTILSEAEWAALGGGDLPAGP